MVEGRDIWRILKGAGVKYVKFVIIDLFGRPRVDIMPIDMSADAFTDGIPYDGSSIPAYATVNKSDVVAFVDPGSIFVETWNDGKTALVFTHTYDGSAPSMMDPRNVLADALKKVKSAGYTPIIGGELEFFVVRGNPPSLMDKGVYFEGLPNMMSIDVVGELLHHMERSGIGLSKTHHEVAPSQYEINLPHGDPLRVADTIVALKIMSKAIAQKHGTIITFMPKPFWGMNGSGAHIHVSFWKDGKNLFASVKEPTDELKAAVAGILEHAIEASAIVAPTVNSYKRLVPHYEAPTRVVWGIGNRSAMVRIPYYGGKINRFEYRHPDPSMNPYLGFAAIVLAAYRGMSQKLVPPTPIGEVAYELEGVRETPRHLGEALKYFAEGRLASELPSEFVKEYMALKEKEWSEYTSTVGSWESTWNTITPWEYDRYLEVY